MTMSLVFVIAVGGCAILFCRSVFVALLLAWVGGFVAGGAYVLLEEASDEMVRNLFIVCALAAGGMMLAWPYGRAAAYLMRQMLRPVRRAEAA